MTRKHVMLMLLSIVLITTVLFVRYTGTADPFSSSSTVTKGKNGSDSQADTLQARRTNIEIKVAVSMEAAEFGKLQQLNEQYEQSHLGIKVLYDNIAHKDAYEQLKKAAQLSEAPDVMLLDNEWLNEFAVLGYLSYRADEFFSGETQSQQIQSVMSQMKWNGYLWGIPKEVDPYIMVWNKARLQENEWTNPPISTDDLFRLNEQLTQQEENSLGVYFDPADPFAFISLAWSLGVDWFDPQDGELMIDNEENVALLETFFAAPVGKDGTTGSESGIAAFGYNPVSQDWDPWELVQEGRIALMITTASAYKQHAKESLGVAPLPLREAADTQQGGWISGKSYAVSSKSAHVQEAFEWIRDFTREDVQLKLMEAGGGLPVNAAIYDTQPLLADPPLKTFVIPVKQGKVFPVDPYLTQKMSILTSQMKEMLQGSIGVKEFTEQIRSYWTGEEAD